MRPRKHGLRTSPTGSGRMYRRLAWLPRSTRGEKPVRRCEPWPTSSPTPLLVHRLITDPDPIVRGFASEALASITTFDASRVEPYLRELTTSLRDDAPAVRAATADTLARLIDTDIATDGTLRVTAPSWLDAVRDALPDLRPLLASDNLLVQKPALCVFRTIVLFDSTAISNHVDAIRELVDHEDPVLARRAAMALLYVTPERPDAIEPVRSRLCQVCSDSSRPIRVQIAAAATLAVLGDVTGDRATRNWSITQLSEALEASTPHALKHVLELARVRPTVGAAVLPTLDEVASDVVESLPPQSADTAPYSERLDRLVAVGRIITTVSSSPVELDPAITESLRTSLQAGVARAGTEATPELVQALQALSDDVSVTKYSPDNREGDRGGTQ